MKRGRRSHLRRALFFRILVFVIQSKLQKSLARWFREVSGKSSFDKSITCEPRIVCGQRDRWEVLEAGKRPRHPRVGHDKMVRNFALLLMGDETKELYSGLTEEIQENLPVTRISK